MANVRFFKGVYPRQKLFIDDGSYLMLEDIGNEEGVLRVGNERIQQQIDILIRERRGGLTEIDEKTYDELKKNATRSLPPFREEIRMGVGLTRNNIPVLEPSPFPPGPTNMFGHAGPVAGKLNEPQKLPEANIDRPTATKK